MSLQRKIETSNAFKRDYKKKDILNTPFIDVLYRLINDEPLPEKYKDHSLIGDWSGYRECHIQPDLLLIYKKSDEGLLKLARLGSHSELF